MHSLFHPHLVRRHLKFQDTDFDPDVGPSHRHKHALFAGQQTAGQHHCRANRRRLRAVGWCGRLRRLGARRVARVLPRVLSGVLALVLAGVLAGVAPLVAAGIAARVTANVPPLVLAGV